MIDLEKLNLAGLESAVNRYRNVLHHRTIILEGIRKIAFRNMAHFAEAATYCETKKGIGTDEAAYETWIHCVQANMLNDQQLENNKINRIMIYFATFAPLWLYLALLYAEIEFFRDSSRKDKLFFDDGLGTYLDKNQKFVDRLKNFRHSFLHVGEQGFPVDQDIARPDLNNIVPVLQKNIDEYLQRTRFKLFRYLVSNLEHLPEIQRRYCESLFLDLNIRRMELHNDLKGMEHCVNQVQKLSQKIENIPDNVRCWSPNLKQRQVASNIAQCLNELSPSGPEQQFTQPETKQTPMYFNPLLAFLSERKPIFHGNSRHENHITQHIDYYTRMIITAGVLLNEVIYGRQSLDIYGLKSAGQLHTIVKTMTPEEFNHFHQTRSSDCIGRYGLQRADEWVAPSRVSTALLYEPLRAYIKVLEHNREISNSRLNAWVHPDRLGNLRRYRNSVFHILDAVKNPVNEDLMVADSMPVDAGLHDLYIGLSQFLGLWAKPSD